MIDADATLDVTVTCDQCKISNGKTEYPDPWDWGNLQDMTEGILQDFIEEGWEIEDEDALCPDCVEARDNDEEPLDPNRNNGGVDPRYGVGLRLFDE